MVILIFSKIYLCPTASFESMVNYIYHFTSLQRASLAEKEMDSIKDEDMAGDNFKRTNGGGVLSSSSVSPRRDEDEEMAEYVDSSKSAPIDCKGSESRDQRVSPKDAALNGTHQYHPHHHKNDSNNNAKPSGDKPRPKTPNQSAQDVHPDKESSAKEQRTSFEMDDKREKEDGEGATVRPKPSLDAMSKSSFASELINNIRNSRNLLGNSHNELADEITGKNKEVSVKDRPDSEESCLKQHTIIIIVNCKSSACGHRVNFLNRNLVYGQRLWDLVKHENGSLSQGVINICFNIGCCSIRHMFLVGGGGLFIFGQSTSRLSSSSFQTSTVCDDERMSKKFSCIPIAISDTLTENQ